MNNEKEIKKPSFTNIVKERVKAFQVSWHDSTKKKVRSRKILGTSGKILRGFLLTGLCFVILLPLFQKFSFALRDPSDITNPQVVFIPDMWSVENIRISLAYLNYKVTFLNSIVLSAITTVIQVISTALAGYSFARLKFKGSNIFFYIVVFTLVVPYETLDRARFLLFQNVSFFGIQLINNAFAVYIMSVFGMGIRSAVFIFLFRQFFRNIPVELEESAEIDGAGVIKTFSSVMLPNANGVIVVVSLFSFVWQYNDYYFAHLFQFEEAFPVLSTKLAAGSDSLYGVLVTSFGDLIDKLGENIKNDPLFFGLITNTAALLMMLPLLIGYFFVQRKFVEGIERTGLTGM